MYTNARAPHDAAADDDGVHRIREIGGQMSAPIETRGIAVRSFDPERRTVTVEFSHGAAVRRRAWVNGRGVVEYDEILEVSERAVDLRRLKAGAPVLDSHSSYSTRAQLAVTENPRIEGDVAVSDIRFPSPGVDEDADRMASMVSEGIIKNISCGYSRDKIRIEPPKKDGEVEKWIVERWTPHEISFVTIGADPSAQVRGQAESGEVFPVIFNRATPQNDEVKMKVTQGAGGQESPENSAILAERQRVQTAYDLQRRHGLPNGWADQVIERGAGIEAMRTAALNYMADRDAADAGGARHVLDPMVDASGANVLAEAFDAIVSGRSIPAEIANEIGGRRFSDLARYSLRRQRGLAAGAMNDSRVITEALMRSSGGYQGTADFATLLENAMNKELLRRDAREASGIRLVAFKGRANDFRPQNRYRGGAFPVLQDVNEHGEFKSGAMPDGARESLTIATKGSITRITRQALVNDDLGAFERVVELAGEAVNATIAKQLQTTLENPGNLSDGNAVFSIARGNLAAAGAALSETTLTAAKLAMRNQVDLTGEKAGVTPKFLLVPPALEVTAQKLLSTVQATKTADVNPFAGTLDLIVESRLTSQTAWYLFADPNAVRALEYAFLDGAEGGQIETKTGWEVDGIEVKSVLDIGAAFIDPRGVFKNAGA